MWSPPTRLGTTFNLTPEMNINKRRKMFETLVIIVGILLVIAAIGDIRHLKIPNWIPASIALLYGIAVALSFSSNMIEAPILWLPSIAISAILLFGFTTLFALGHIGGGDVKLIAATSLWAGPTLIIEFLLGMALVGGLLSLLIIIKSKVWGDTTPIILTQNSESHSAATQFPMPYGVAVAAGGLIIVQRLFMADLNT